MRENRNQFLMLYASSIIRKHIRLCCLAFLRKSHTHDRIDQMWGVLARKLATEARLLTPDDAISCIRTVLTSPAIHSWIGSSTRISVKKLDRIRDWRTHFAQVGVKLSGGMLRDATANHLFAFMLRKGHGPVDHTVLSLLPL